MQDPVIVFGGTGHYGQYIVHSLLNKKIPVRVFSRNVAKAKTVFSEHEELDYYQGDVLNSDQVRGGIEGCRAVVVTLSAMHSKIIRKQWAIEHDAVIDIMRIAEEEGVNRFIYISVYDLDKEFIEEINLEVGYLKIAVEKKLRESKLNWTIFGAPPSMQLFAAMRRGSRLIALGGGPPALPTIAPQDMGEVVAQAVLREDLGGKRFRVQAPEKMSHRLAAEIYSEYLDKEIKYQKIPTIPLKIISLLTRPFNPYLSHLYQFVKLLNKYPQYLVEEIPSDHEHLLSVFDYKPTDFRTYIASLDDTK